MYIRLYFIIIAILIIAGCSSTKNLGVYRQQAEAAEAESNFTEAVNAWALYFNEHNKEEFEPEGTDYARAAKAAYKAGMPERAVEWFDKARYRGYSDKDMYYTLAKIFRTQNNLSKELSSLEFYYENFGKDNPDINSRLFDIYYEIDDIEKTLSIQERLSEEDQNSEKYLNIFFELNKQLGNDEETDSLSLKLLEISPEHTGALEWNAEKLYHTAENHYQDAIEKYEKNKTRRQYRILLNELKQVTVEFKTALKYFEKLWNQNQDKKYAPYLTNIYTRLNDKARADYYRKFL
ncbi:MAG: hypothetical protein PHH93_01940 [Prolixibacteraceae bacterium]|nr:hypothetical protein [Prolixibacteraceae bacterium]